MKPHAITSPDAAPACPKVRKIDVSDLKYALRKGPRRLLDVALIPLFSGLDLPNRRHWPRCRHPVAFNLSAHVGFRFGWPLCGNWLVRDKPATGTWP